MRHLKAGRRLGRNASHRLAILAVFAHRIERVGNRQNPRRDGNLVAAQSVWVTVPIPSLVMMTHHGHHRIRKADALKKFVTYALGPGQSFAEGLGYGTLPKQVIADDKTALNRVGG